MYDDYDLDYSFSNEYTFDEDTYYEYHSQCDTLDLDEEYDRDGNDYQELAYRHYAWYNLEPIHTTNPC